MNSIWSKTCELPRREALAGDLRTEVAVVGAGMAGVLIAAALQEKGRAVVVLDAGRIAGGQTRNTTAKITAQHGLIYSRLLATFGEEKARQYAQANLQAVEQYRALVRDRGIDCDFETRSSYVYGDDRALLEQETEAARTLGLPADFVTELAIPLPAAGAVRFAGQAQFHPLKFLRALSEGLTIYEDTPVRTAEEDRLITPRGTVRAEQLVFACHFPFLNFPGLYFTRMHQQRAYVLALDGAPQVDGMWIGAGEGGVSLRNYGSLLLLGGENHRTGENSAGGCYERLRQIARTWFPDSREAAHWSAQDCMTPDGVPYIGPCAASRPGWYVATGFQKWGMTTSMVAAGIVRDLICGTPNPYGEIFDPGRFGLQTLRGIAQESGQAIKGLSRRLFGLAQEAAADIPPGHGGIVSLEGEKVGIYKEETGTIHPVELRCPHLGCQLEWNPDECSWECPCHGSRFDRYGQLVSGPAQEDIRHG